MWRRDILDPRGYAAGVIGRSLSSISDLDLIPIPFDPTEKSSGSI
jgi:hypothetical protein